MATLLIAGTAVGGIWYYATPKYTRVGYTPNQPIPFSHEIHVKQLGMDCRYCHSKVEESPHANIPTTQTCMNCHSLVQKDSPKLEPLRESWRTGRPVQWVQIHRTPDYVYFDHSVHVNRGVSCVSCHGKINEMPVVRHDQPMSMGWCLDCHRHPETAVRPLDRVFDLDWKPTGEAEGGASETGIAQAQTRLGKRLVEQRKIDPPQNCSGCHR